MIPTGAIGRLHARVAAVAPIHGVASDGAIDFQDGATKAQRIAAQAVVDGFDPAAAPDISPEAEAVARVVLKALGHVVPVDLADQLRAEVVTVKGPKHAE